MSSLRQLGRYRVESYMGSRGDTDAYRAFDMIRKRTVLLLTLKPEISGDEHKLQRILQTAQDATDLVHPRLGWVWETGNEDGVVYVAERYVNGSSLRERLEESGPLSWEEASQAMEQLAQGLDFLHGQGRVHGAVCPENIILSTEVGAVLGGLGVPEAPMRLADLGPPADGETEAEEEAANQAAASPADNISAAHYTAPEVWMGETPTPLSDQYALACVLAEMLSGRPLIAGATAAEVCKRSLEGATLPGAWPPGTPWQIEPVLERALSHNPAERFSSAGDFAAAPARMAARPPSDEDERRQREAQRQARLEFETQARRQAEEAARLAALDRARRELEEQVSKETEALPEAAPVIPQIPEILSTAPVGSMDKAVLTEHRRRAARTQSAGKLRRWLVWAGAAILLLALAWAWNSRRLPGGGMVSTPTSSPSLAVTQPAAAPPTIAPSQTATWTPTTTLAPSPTRTRQPTATATASPTPTVTISPTATTRPSATPTRRPTREMLDRND